MPSSSTIRPQHYARYGIHNLLVGCYNLGRSSRELALACWQRRNAHEHRLDFDGERDLLRQFYHLDGQCVELGPSLVRHHCKDYYRDRSRNHRILAVY